MYTHTHTHMQHSVYMYILIMLCVWENKLLCCCDTYSLCCVCSYCVYIYCVYIYDIYSIIYSVYSIGYAVQSVQRVYYTVHIHNTTHTAERRGRRGAAELFFADSRMKKSPVQPKVAVLLKPQNLSKLFLDTRLL